ncbi:ABC transporter substrate-binding protein [Paenibacillus sp. P96]|uniref:ABC transporter substrate-binding protein n=1 Tax=Paenibacillus zeirhizosphaerae TaxID=2987519 RepID=A0ABT9FTF0_9BACL|nr:ABC transporter substrate-binding protein [Paenibacillus sp. P96]MDP4097993.1 ABC transporter substrate-binding protein [Paenibacillus sp. P96]
MKKMWMSLTLAGLLLTAVGCGNNGSGGEQASGNEQSGGNAEGKNYKVAISQIVEHPSLDATREGFLAGLKDAGIEEGKNLTVDYNNAQGDAATNLSIAQKIAGDDSDLALAIATAPAQALVQQIQDKPVLFAAVTDPLGAKIVSDLNKPGANVTGASDTNPDAVVQLMDFVATELPDIKTVGLVLNEGEPNAVVMADNAEKALGAHGIKLIKAPVTNTSEVKQAADSLVGKVDAFFITLDNTVVSAVDTMIQVANDNDIPFFSSDRDTVEKGAMATVGFKYYDHGYQVGQTAAKILKDGENPGDMPVTFPDKLDLILNVKAAKEQGVEVTDSMKAKVQDQANNIIE